MIYTIGLRWIEADESISIGLLYDFIRSDAMDQWNSCLFKHQATSFSWWFSRLFSPPLFLPLSLFPSFSLSRPLSLLLQNKKSPIVICLSIKNWIDSTGYSKINSILIASPNRHKFRAAIGREKKHASRKIEKRILFWFFYLLLLNHTFNCIFCLLVSNFKVKEK